MVEDPVRTTRSGARARLAAIAIAIAVSCAAAALPAQVSAGRGGVDQLVRRLAAATSDAEARELLRAIAAHSVDAGTALPHLVQRLRTADHGLVLDLLAAIVKLAPHAGDVTDGLTAEVSGILEPRVAATPGLSNPVQSQLHRLRRRLEIARSSPQALIDTTLGSSAEERELATALLEHHGVGWPAILESHLAKVRREMAFREGREANIDVQAVAGPRQAPAVMRMPHVPGPLVLEPRAAAAAQVVLEGARAGRPVPAADLALCRRMVLRTGPAAHCLTVLQELRAAGPAAVDGAVAELVALFSGPDTTSPMAPTKLHAWHTQRGHEHHDGLVLREAAITLGFATVPRARAALRAVAEQTRDPELAAIARTALRTRDSSAR